MDKIKKKVMENPHHYNNLLNNQTSNVKSFSVA